MQTTKFKRLLSGVLSAVMVISTVPIASAHAEESTEPYPYTMFAASSDEGAITINAGNFCVNGSVATNGTIVSSGNMNINGTRTEHANESMLYVLKKLNYSYFSGENVTTYTEDYIYEDLNININNPIDVDGSIDLTGSINLNSGIKAVDDVTINGEVKNSNNAIICSETGDINIETSNVSFNGLIYAPYGDIVIHSDNLNLNRTIMVANTITIDAPNGNVNYDPVLAAELQTDQHISDDTELNLIAYGEYNAAEHAVDISWYTTIPEGTFEIQISDDGTDYETSDTLQNASSYRYAVPDDCARKYFRVTETADGGKTAVSVPFVLEQTADGYQVGLIDSDGDGLYDIYEEMYGTDPFVPDTDADGLTDYQEIYRTDTDPLVFDSVEDGVSDADADCDCDDLSNIFELEHETNPLLKDSDLDGLNDYEEVVQHNTDPLSTDSDNDLVSDFEEIELNLDPWNPETFGYPDAQYCKPQTLSEDSPVFSKINGENMPYSLSMDVTASGLADKNLTVKSSDASIAADGYGVIGLIPQIEYPDDLIFSDAVLHFRISDSYVSGSEDDLLKEYDYAASNSELEGIRRFNIFKYDTEAHMMLPVETTVDEETNTLSAAGITEGSYCVVDMRYWFHNFGIEPENFQYTDADGDSNVLNSANMLMSRVYKSALKAEENNAATECDILGCVSGSDTPAEATVESGNIMNYKKAPTLNRTSLIKSTNNTTEQTNIKIDLAIALQANGMNEELFNLQRFSILSFAKQVYETTDIRIKIVQATAANNYIDSGWLDNYNDLNIFINSMKYQTNSGSGIDTGVSCAYDHAARSDFRNAAQKCLMWVWSTSHSYNSSYTYYHPDTLADNPAYDQTLIGNSTFFHSTSASEAFFGQIISKDQTNYKYFVKYAKEINELAGAIYEYYTDLKFNPEETELTPYQILASDGLSYICLGEPIQKNGKADYDEDGLTDYEEIVSELITWDTDGKIKQLPTFQEYLDYYGDFHVYEQICRYFSSMGMAEQYAMKARLENTRLLPIHSNPVLPDTDFDGYDDAQEKEYDEDPFVSNILLFSTDIDDLSRYYFYAASCKDQYDDSGVQQFLVWVGNNIYGANHDDASMFRKQLLNYFSNQNESILKCKTFFETVNTYNTLINQVNTCARNVVSICDAAARSKYFIELNKLQILIKDYTYALNSLRRNTDSAEKIGELAVKYINSIHSYTIGINNVVHKFDTLDKIYQNKIIVYTNKITGDGTTHLGRILYVGLGFLDATADAIMIDAMSGLIQENIDVVKLVMFWSEYETQSFAATQIYAEIDNAGYAVLDRAFNCVTAVARYGLDGEARIAIGELCPEAATVVAGIAISDFTFKVSDTAKSIFTTIGDAMMGNLLYDELVRTVSPGNPTLIMNGHYSIKTTGAQKVLTLYSNLICARIQGENTIIATLDQYPLWLQAYLSVWGIDCIDATEDCNRNIESMYKLLDKAV